MEYFYKKQDTSSSDSKEIDPDLVSDSKGIESNSDPGTCLPPLSPTEFDILSDNLSNSGKSEGLVQNLLENMETRSEDAIQSENEESKGFNEDDIEYDDEESEVSSQIALSDEDNINNIKKEIELWKLKYEL